MTRALPVDAQSGELPQILVAPPWQKRPKPTVIEVATTEFQPVRLAWLPEERQVCESVPPQFDWPEAKWRKEIEQAVAATETGVLDYRLVELLADAPEALARPHLPLLEQIHPTRRCRRQWSGQVGGVLAGAHDRAHLRLLARFGSEVAGFVFVAVATQYWRGMHTLSVFEGTEATTLMLDWLDHDDGRAYRGYQWFRRHQRFAVAELIARALGKGVKARRQAESVLRMLDREVVLAAAAVHGEQVVAEIVAMLDRDPLLLLPTRIPKAPEWVQSDTLPRIRLRSSSGVLPESAVAHLISMIMMSSDTRYAGLPSAVEALDPGSLDEFAWALYSRWQRAKYPAKQNPWALRALGWLGNDVTAARLRRIAERDRSVTRAEEALGALVSMGTRNAHMHIQRVRENTVHPYVRGRADMAITEILAELGITAEEFADRAVADLGLSADGTLVLDYGPRHFVVGLDERLKPVVREADGKVRATLPKPAAADDQALASAAYSRFGSFKKLVQEAISDESARLEQAMVSERRWRADRQRELIIEHPLLGQLARRVVWATFGTDGRVTGTFRVDADGTLADIEDEVVELAGETPVGVAHPLHMGGVLGAWGEVFADYQLLQPFSQLERVSFEAGSEGMEAGLTPFRGRTVPTGKLLGLPKLGWVKGYGPGGVNEHFTRTQPGGNRVWVTFSPGINGRNPMEIPEQRLDNIGTDQDLVEMSPIAASELLRELHTLAV